MSKSASDLVSQDIREIKDELITWMPDILGRDLHPFIKTNDTKSRTRGWNHPDIARLLCMPIKLPVYDKDPESYVSLHFLSYLSV